jgi:hypothetical protein
MFKNLCLPFLFGCLLFTAAASALTVFNVDLNGMSDSVTPNLAPFGEYTGGAPGAFDDGINRWNVYVGGWAVRLVPDEIPTGANWQISKVFLGWEDPNNVTSTDDGSNSLFLDYASKKATVAPVLDIIGGVNTANGTNYSQGVYDLYLYGNGVCSFDVIATPPQTDPLTEPTPVTTTVNLSGHTPADANYFLNQNYAVVPNLDSSRTISIKINSGGLAGLQLVDKGIRVPQAFPLPGDTRNGTDFSPAWCSFGYDKSRIGTGPFTAQWSDMMGFYGLLAQTEAGEWDTYELYVVGDANAGFYEINCAYCADTDNSGTPGGAIGTVSFQIDNAPAVSVTVNDTGTWAFANGWTPFQRIYLSKGYHRLKFSLGAAVNVWGFRVRKADTQTVSSCMDARLKGSSPLPSDLNSDCVTNFKDFGTFAAQWLTKCAGCP